MSDQPVAAGKSSLDLIDIDRAFALFDLQPESTFLDLACGIGKYSLEVAARCGQQVKVIAVDLWAEGIGQLKQEIASGQIKSITPLLADIRQPLELESDSIDTCLLATILHDLQPEEQKIVIRETARLLKPEGLLNIIEFKKVDARPGPPKHIRLDEQDIEHLVCPCGFINVATNDVGAHTYLTQYRLNV